MNKNVVIELETILNRLNNLTFKNNSTANNYKYTTNNAAGK